MSTTSSQTRRIAFGTAIRLAGRTLGALISLVATREATRYFGDQWGGLTAALSWFTIFTYIGTPGMGFFTQREIARPNADKSSLFGRAVAATLLISIISGIVALAICIPAYSGRGPTLPMEAVLAVGIPVAAMFMLCCAVLVGMGRGTWRALMDPASSIFLLAATIVIVSQHMSPTHYAAGYTISLVASAVVAVSLAAIAGRPRFKGAARGTLKMLKDSAPLGQFDLFAVVYARADSVMLFLIQGSRPTAWYGLAFQVATFIFVLPGLLTNALLPDFMAADPERQKFLARRALDVIMTLALPLPLFGVVFSRPFVVWLEHGSKFNFAPAGTLMAILTFAAALALFNGYLSQMAVYAGAEKGLWRIIGIVTATNLISNAVAVTFWSATGAACVMILSEFVGLCLYWRLYRRTIPYRLPRRYPIAVALATLGTVVIWLGLRYGAGLTPGSGIAFLPRAIGLLGVYLALVYALSAAGRRFGKLRDESPQERT